MSWSRGLAWVTVVAAFAALLSAAVAMALDQAIWNVAWTSAAVSAVAGALAARGSLDGDARRQWTWWLAASACWLGGQIVWDTFGVLGVPASPNLADAGWWAFAVLVVAGLLVPSGQSQSMRRLAVVEALPLIVAVMAGTCAWLWDDAAASALPLSGRVSVLLYPVLYVSAAVLMLQATVAGSLAGTDGPASRVVLGGVVATALGFVGWGPALLAGDYVMGESIVDPLWVVGMVCVGAGGLVAARAGSGAAHPQHEPGRRSGVLPAGVFVLLIAALVYAESAGAPLAPILSLAAGLFVCGGMLIARGALLGARLRWLLARERSARQDLAGREAELASLNERLAEDTRRDPLTGLLNRRALAMDLPADAAAGAGPVALALCDIDRFKSYNDRLGHLAGDQALRSLAETVRAGLRDGDAAYRFGGEELLLVLRTPDADAAVAVAERIRAAVADAALPHPDGLGGVITVSIGVSFGAADPGALLAAADSALYEAKAGGRNRVVGPSASTVHRPSARRRSELIDEPILRHLRGVLAIGRAAATGRGPQAVAEALAQTIRSELRFETVAVNLLDRTRDESHTVLVLGEEEARAALEGSRTPWKDWAPLVDPRHERCGALWLPAGAHDFTADTTVWISRAPVATVLDAWQPEDMLLLPLRASTGELFGIVSVDSPRTGRRPDDAEITILMAVAEHAAVALEHIQREHALLDASHELPEHRLAAVMLLAETLDLRDAGTARHSQTVGGYARDIARGLGLPAERVERIRAAGVLHDLGKLGIADAILHKPGPLDDDEWREMKRHPETGARILDHSGLADIASWVRAHHERIDGRGYPLGLAGEEIPLEARILAVADAYEAMTADRPYRFGLSAAEADAELRRCAGTQFDERVVDAFLGRRGLVAPPARHALPAA